MYFELDNRLSKNQSSGILFAIFSVILPVGLRYRSEPSYTIEFFFPLRVVVTPTSLRMAPFTSSLGILLPVFVTIHLLLVWQGLKIIKGESNTQHIIYLLLISVVVSLVGFTNAIPLPLMLPIGLLLAKVGEPKQVQGPFENESMTP